MKVWIDGHITSPNEARVPVLDHGLLYGDGVFEGIRCHDTRIADLELHLKRLAASARALHLGLPSQQTLTDIVFDTVAALGEADAYIRLVVTRGSGALGIDISSCAEPRVFCIAGALKLYPVRAGGIAMATVSWRRPDPDVLDPRVKSLNYLNNVLSKVEAKQRGADEALVLNKRGVVAEAAGANVFCCSRGTVRTPPLSDGALGGITRRRVLLVAEQLGMRTAEASLSRYDLLDADEVFVTGTGAGIVHVGSLDGAALGESHEVSDAISSAAKHYIAQYGTPVPGLQRLAS